MQPIINDSEQAQLRIIKTARTEKSINEAVEQGYWPLVKSVIPSPDIKAKFAIKQDKSTGKITVINDYRQSDVPLIKPVLPELFGFSKTNTESNLIIDFTYYYPYHFESPFAAYLIPPDLQAGETVILEDLIEDVVGSRWNQGDTYRLQSCKAMWDGKEMILQHDPDKNSRQIVG